MHIWGGLEWNLYNNKIAILANYYDFTQIQKYWNGDKPKNTCQCYETRRQVCGGNVFALAQMCLPKIDKMIYLNDFLV